MTLHDLGIYLIVGLILCTLRLIYLVVKLIIIALKWLVGIRGKRVNHDKYKAESEPQEGEGCTK